VRTLMLLAMAVGICAACSDEPAPDTAPTAPMWLTDRPENAHAYAEDTLARFQRLVEGDGWRDAAWNAQRTLEAVHEKTGLAFVLVPGGDFLMGSTEDEKREYIHPIPGPGEDDEERHRVTVAAFLLCKTECTQRAWDVIGGEDDRGFKGPDLPIEAISWAGAEAWCRKAGLRLPSEVEWETACRAMSAGIWCFGDDRSGLSEYAWFIRNSERSQQIAPGASAESQTSVWSRSLDRRSTHAVGQKLPNAWGLHDMHGNVLEWCQDRPKWYGGTPIERATNIPRLAGSRINRGGSWANNCAECRSSVRTWSKESVRINALGFRPAADLPR
jgi:formylglycine-generating enzyme required for sulfatase activity